MAYIKYNERKIFYYFSDKTFFNGDPVQEVLELKEEEKYTSIVAENGSSAAIVQISVLLLGLIQLLL